MARTGSWGFGSLGCDGPAPLTSCLPLDDQVRDRVVAEAHGKVTRAGPSGIRLLPRRKQPGDYGFRPTDRCRGVCRRASASGWLGSRSKTCRVLAGRRGRAGRRSCLGVAGRHQSRPRRRGCGSRRWTMASSRSAPGSIFAIPWFALRSTRLHLLWNGKASTGPWRGDGPGRDPERRAWHRARRLRIRTKWSLKNSSALLTEPNAAEDWPPPERFWSVRRPSPSIRTDAPDAPSPPLPPASEPASVPSQTPAGARCLGGFAVRRRPSHPLA